MLKMFKEAVAREYFPSHASHVMIRTMSVSSGLC
ncbi:unnamed protein product [Brassica rapa subsp. narinosa]